MRAAKKADSRDAAKLIYMTGEGIFKYLFYPDMNKTVAIIRQLFEMEDNDFSHQNAYTAKLDRQIAGIIVFMDRVTLKKNYRRMGWKIVKVMGFWQTVCRLPRFIQLERLIQMPAETTMYINHIATVDEFRGQGIATHLLNFCEQQAQVNGLSKLALDVEVVNDAAIRVYEELGFKKKQKIENKTLYSRFDFTGLYRMEKEIEG
jgi:ribosomal protein S18 acetylase RimI-like enzyme